MALPALPGGNITRLKSVAMEKKKIIWIAVIALAVILLYYYYTQSTAAPTATTTTVVTGLGAYANKTGQANNAGKLPNGLTISAAPGA